MVMGYLDVFREIVAFNVPKMFPVAVSVGGEV